MGLPIISLCSSGIGVVIASPERSQLVSTIDGRRTRQMTWRSYAVCTSSKAKFSEPALCPPIKPKVVFVFGGQGAQHLDMGRGLFQMYPSFRKSILEMDRVYARKTGMSLIATTGLFHKESIRKYHMRLGDLWPVEVTLPALAMLQCALFDLLECRCFSRHCGWPLGRRDLRIVHLQGGFKGHGG